MAPNFFLIPCMIKVTHGVKLDEYVFEDFAKF